MLQRENSDASTIIISFLAGGMIGAGLALLFAPYSGKKMRGKIADMAEDAKDYTVDYAKKLKEKIA